MKIAIIGSTSLREKMVDHSWDLQKVGHDVRLPFFDDAEMTELQLCQANLVNIRWADRIDIIWDSRSIGTILDFGFAMALEKPIELIYLAPKTLAGVMRQYKAEHDKMEGRDAKDKV